MLIKWSKHNTTICNICDLDFFAMLGVAISFSPKGQGNRSPY